MRPYPPALQNPHAHFGRWAGISALLVALAWGANAAATADVAAADELVSCTGATRNLAFLDLYSLEVLTTDCSVLAPLDLGALAENSVELRVTVHWDRGKPDQLPEIWREELMPICNKTQEATIRSIYEATDKGDNVRIRYAPDSGVSIEYKNEVRLKDPSAEMLRALMELWFVRSPLADALIQRAQASAGAE